MHSSLLKIAFLGALGLMVMVGMLSMNTPQAHAASYAPQSANNAEVVGMIYQVFGPYGAQAVRVASCESSLNPGATNVMAIGNSHAAGLFQILYPSTWYSTSQAGSSPYNAYANIVAAHDIFVRDGYSWREWVCQP